MNNIYNFLKFDIEFTDIFYYIKCVRKVEAAGIIRRIPDKETRI